MTDFGPERRTFSLCRAALVCTCADVRSAALRSTVTVSKNALLLLMTTVGCTSFTHCNNKAEKYVRNANGLSMQVGSKLSTGTAKSCHRLCLILDEKMFPERKNTPGTRNTEKSRNTTEDNQMQHGRTCANTDASMCTRAAMAFRPSGPWYTAYDAATLASSACAVQMLDVALSRRMCCSRVCIAMRSAGLLLESRDTPARGQCNQWQARRASVHSHTHSNISHRIASIGFICHSTQLGFVNSIVKWEILTHGEGYLGEVTAAKKPNTRSYITS